MHPERVITPPKVPARRFILRSMAAATTSLLQEEMEALSSIRLPELSSGTAPPLPEEFRRRPVEIPGIPARDLLHLPPTVSWTTVFLPQGGGSPAEGRSRTVLLEAITATVSQAFPAKRISFRATGISSGRPPKLPVVFSRYSSGGGRR